LYCLFITVLIGDISFRLKNCYSVYQQKGELHMFVFAAVACILLFTLAGSNLFVAQYDSDELSSMGVEEK